MQVSRHLLAVFLLMLPGGGVHAEPALCVENAWVRAAPPGFGVTAGYLDVNNPADSPRRLVGAAGDSFERVEFHQTVESGGVFRMRRLDEIIIPPKTVFSFAPGGHHLMLHTPAQPLREGQTRRITLIFADGERLEFDAMIRRAR